ncbi:MAG TPA: PspC domain-containing protein [Bacteroidales bacterium]|nr:PspC domain-containing protein [Bacteroidales bacterium]
MKRTISVSLNGKAYMLEDDAYHVLDRYLKGLEAHFANAPNKKEIVGDIESRIAEHFDDSIKVPGQVVNLDEVKRVIKLIGTINDFDSSSSFAPSDNKGRVYPKLYRDVDDRILCGVCSGMGHYWRVDPVLFRLVFFLLALWGGLGVLIYIVLWVVVPPAITPTQKLEMKGEKININNI